MRVRHLNCGTMCPPIGPLVTPGRSVFARGLMVCHVLLIETDDAGLVLVDTGMGVEDVRDPRRIGPIRHILASHLTEEETALHQIEQLGFSASDVRHIVLTHLDVDHASGLGDFPRAKVHCLRTEHEEAMHPGWRERHRYFPSQWAHGPEWALYESGGEPWFGFEAVRDLEGLPPEILLVPLDGHSPGHAAIAVDAPDGWLLHCGDAYFFHGEVHAERPHCPPGLAAFQNLLAKDNARRRHNQGRLRELVRAHGEDVRVFSAHDPTELAAFG